MRTIIGKYDQKWLIIGVGKKESAEERLKEIEAFVAVACSHLNKKIESALEIKSIELTCLAGSTIIAIPMQQVELIDEAKLAVECGI